MNDIPTICNGSKLAVSLRKLKLSSALVALIAGVQLSSAEAFDLDTSVITWSAGSNLSDVNVTASATDSIKSGADNIKTAGQNYAENPTAESKQSLAKAVGDYQKLIVAAVDLEHPPLGRLLFNESFDFDGASSAQRLSLSANKGLVIDIKDGTDWTIKNGSGTQDMASGIRNAGGYFVQRGNGSLHFVNNEVNSAGNGGAISNSGSMVFSGSVDFQNNSAAMSGGAVYNGAGTLYFGKMVSFTNNSSNGSGGAVYATGSDPLIFNDTAIFTGNSSTTEGGAIAADNNSSLIFDGTTTFTDNRSTTKGGAIAADNNSSLIFDEAATFTGNRSTTDGGAIAADNQSSFIFDGAATFTGNSAISNGGAIYAKELNSFKFNGTANFTDNGSNAQRGTIYVDSNNSFTFNGAATFSGNRSINRGGAISAADNNSFVFNDAAIFTGNSSNDSGGAISAVAGNSFTFNGATTFSGNSSAGSGGAIAAGRGNSLIFNGAATFDGNSSISDGGAIATSGQITLAPAKGQTIAFFGNNAFSGHKDKERANSLYLQGGAQLTVSGAGMVDMLDPMNGSGSVIKQTAGIWYLAGANSLNYTQFSVENATLNLYASGETSRTGQKDKNGAVKATLGSVTMDGDTSVFNLGDNSRLAVAGIGNFIAVNDGKINIADSANFDFNIAAVKPSDDTMLRLSAKNITMGKQLALNLQSYGEDGSYHLLHLDGAEALTRDKVLVTVAGQPRNEVDFLQGGAVNVSEKDVRVSLGILSWYGEFYDPDRKTIQAHGNFTVKDGSFTVSKALVDRAPAQYLYDWDGKTLTKKGAGTLILNAVNEYTGDTHINEGQLLIGGSIDNNTARIAGNVVAENNTLFGGYGTVYGNVDMRSGSTISPGASIGTLTVGGLTLRSGSNYLFETNLDGSADKIVVDSSHGGSGKATLEDGVTLTINQIKSNKLSYQPYIILSADKGVTGKFTNVVNNLTFFDYKLVYNPQDIELNLFRNGTSFSDIGQTFNQINTGYGVDSLPTDNDIVSTLVKMTGDQARSALDALSGEIYGSTRSALVNNSRYMRDAINRRMLTSSRLPSDDPLWLASWGYGGHISGDGNAIGVDNSAWGLALGLDGEAFENGFAGVVLGYENMDIKNGGNRNSRSDVDSYHMGAYLASELNGIKLRGGLDYSYLDLSTERHLAIPHLESKAEASYNGYRVQLFAEASTDVKLSEEALLAPYANVTQVWLHMDDANETGSKANLSIAGDTDQVLLTTIGVRGSYKLPTTKTVSLYGDLGWVHAYGDTDGTTKNRFENFGNAFSIKGVGVDNNVGLAAIGFATQLTKNSSVDVGYQGQFGQHQIEHSANLQWKLKF